ncbi:unnamed protein product [Adineta steineri]|uniref:Hexosyltransferase n=1 Tax=Adineta steineri TaxID=433720 RepID=A0A813NRF0_9BILA|nr:unnamed protein product [Adineta steineri]CAF0754468.1 unnamed protein product [Adineta steineri]CAF0870593.1 unnamed protein product [Adineta steineri]
MRYKFSLISLLFHRSRLKSRYILSILVGLSLGFTLSLACLPMISVCDNPLLLFSEPFSSSLNNQLSNETFSLRDTIDRILNRHARSVADVTLVDYGSKDYEPRIVQPSMEKNLNNQSLSTTTQSSNTPKVTRPRYIADELGIREKVLVAVITETNHLNTFAFFLNQTLQNYVNRLLFFIDEDVQDFPKSMEVVAIHDKRAYLKPFYILKYLAEKMIKSYDWFVLVPDNTYIRGFKLNEFLNHISISQDLYMGQPFDDVHAVYCYFGSGIILSGTILRKVLDEIDWCTNNAYSQDLTDNIGRCILKAAKSPCVNTASNYKFTAYVNYRFEFDTDIDKLSKNEEFNQTLTVHPVNDLETMLKLQKYFNQVEIDEMTRSISKYEETIENLSCYAPEGCGNIPWPVGVPPPFKPTSRFDVLRWDYFNETHIYLKTDIDVIDPMKDDDHEEIHEVINYAVEQLQKKYGIQLKFKKLINGYRQFDPTRGTHYIMDLSLIDENKIEFIKRAELMRPLGLVEIVPMPFVTESTKIFLILPIYSDEQSVAIRFLHYANKTLFDKETRDKFELHLTHIITTKQELSQSQKWFDNIRHEIDLIHRTRTQLVVLYHTIHLPSTSSITRYTHTTHILDYFETKFRTNSLVFLTNPYVNIESDFLNRCRLNVIENVQLFFPIAFYQYHPHIITRTYHMTDNSTIELHKSHGWFNSYAFDHIGLYMNDYLKLKQTILLHNISLSSMNFYDLFIQLTDIHILRAPDQSLRVHYHAIKCDSIKQLNNIEYNRCLMQKEKGLASRSQLAMIIIENEQTKKTDKKKK